MTHNNTMETVGLIKNKNSIIRLSKYKNALYRLKALGFVKVFSDVLGEETGVMATQVRKDFSIFGISGNKRGGYQVDSLLEELNRILVKNEAQNVIIVGYGKIGAALMNYKRFSDEGIHIVAAFDIDPAKQNKNDSIQVLPFAEMPEFIKKHGIEIGILAVPDIAAQQVFDLMISSGIKGILNFVPLQLRAPEKIVVTNVNLEYELESVIYFVNAHKKLNEKNWDKTH